MNGQIMHAAQDDEANSESASWSGFLKNIVERSGLRGMVAVAALVLISASCYSFAYVLLASLR